jgi:hypothetical protein
VGGDEGEGDRSPLKLFNDSPAPLPSPIEGEGAFLIFYEIIKFEVSVILFIFSNLEFI